MKEALTVIIVASAIILITFVLLQQKGGGLGSAFGGESGAYRTKRGAEKFIFYGTIVFAIIFLGSILLNFILK